MSAGEKAPREGGLPARLCVGLAQGIALYALAEWEPLAERAAGEGAGLARVRDALWLVALFAPLPALFGIANLPMRKLVPWALAAAAALFVFGWFAAAPAWRNAPPAIWLFALIVIFILHEFVQAGHDDGRRIAAYETYFDRSWRHGFQAALSIGFVIAFWIVVALGATMFRLIGLEIVPRAVFSDEFRWIASSVAFAAGVHLTDADAGLTRGARQIGLALLGWLAILMTLILGAFLAALPFTGLEPLWDTGYATVLLLNAAATMILLVNAAYQAGEPPRSGVMRAVVRFSAVPLAGIVGLAALGLYLRVNQYGFTPARVLAGAELMIVAVYAAGYLAAAARPGAWLALIRPVNIGAAMFVALTLTALMTPILDPSRVAVADQVARLDRGVVEPDDFDFSFLADSRAGHWGEKALAQLSARSGDARSERIALLAKNPAARPLYGAGDQTFNERRAALSLVGPGAIPDAALLPTGGEEDPVSSCVSSMKQFAEQRRIEEERARQRARLGRRLTETDAEARARAGVAPTPVGAEADPYEGRCLARLIDLDGDGDEDLLILANPSWSGRAPLAFSALLNEGGTFGHRAAASGAERERVAYRAALENLSVVAHPYADIVLAGQRLRIEPAAAPAPAPYADLVELVDAVAPPLQATPAPYLPLGDFCASYNPGDGEKTCLSRDIALGDGGPTLHAVFSLTLYSAASVALFDRDSGAYVARGDSPMTVDTITEGEAAPRDAKERAEWRRRIVRAATSAPPLLGDLLIDGERVSFTYVAAPAPR